MNDAIVYVLDDDPQVREALTAFLMSTGRCVIAFADVPEYVAHTKADVPSCLLLDLELPGMNGLDLQESLIGQDGPPIIFVTGRGDVRSSVRAMKAGALEFLVKPIDEDELIKAIDIALARDSQMREQRAHLCEIESRYRTLTPRERDVLPHIVSGLLNKQTAGELGTSEITIRIHRGKIMRKMKASSLADLVRLSAQLGIP